MVRVLVGARLAVVDRFDAQRGVVGAERRVDGSGPLPLDGEAGRGGAEPSLPGHRLDTAGQTARGHLEGKAVEEDVPCQSGRRNGRLPGVRHRVENSGGRGRGRREGDIGIRHAQRVGRGASRELDRRMVEVDRDRLRAQPRHFQDAVEPDEIAGRDGCGIEIRGNGAADAGTRLQQSRGSPRAGRRPLDLACADQGLLASADAFTAADAGPDCIAADPIAGQVRVSCGQRTAWSSEDVYSEANRERDDQTFHRLLPHHAASPARLRPGSGFANAWEIPDSPCAAGCNAGASIRRHAATWRPGARSQLRQRAVRHCAASSTAVGGMDLTRRNGLHRSRSRRNRTRRAPSALRERPRYRC